MKLPALSVAIVLVGVPVMAVADKLDDAYQGLQDAVAKKDAAQVKKWVAEAAPLITESLGAPAPQSDDEKAVWTARVDYVKSVGEYAEYALSFVSVGAPPATVVDLIAALEHQNPRSKYLEGAYAPYLVALNQTGGAAKIPAIAEKALANFPDNVDLLGVLADSAFGKQQNDRALSLANRLIAAFGKPKPEVVPEAEWTRKRPALLGRAYWTEGLVYSLQNDFNPADKNLRAALPLIQGNNGLMGPALFYLGLANNQLGKQFLNKARVLEGARFSEQSAAIPGPYAEQARHNALVMKSDAEKMR